MTPANSDQPTLYIIGAGVAGWLAARAVAARQPNLKLRILDGAAQVGAGLTVGNGRSLTATEGLVAAAVSAADWQRWLTTPLKDGGYRAATEQDCGWAEGAILPSNADPAVTDYLAGVQAAADDRSGREANMVAFGRANLALWREWAAAEPNLAARTGLHLGQKLRFYEGASAEQRAAEEVARLQGAGLAADRVSVATVIAHDPALADWLGHWTGAITRQPGGAIQAGRLAQELAAQLTAGGRAEFWGETTVTQIHHQGDRITGLEAIVRGQATSLGDTNDLYLVATGFDRLLSAAGLLNEALFPVAGTSIILPIAPSVLGDRLPFSRRAWKQDGWAGPLVISPTCEIAEDYLAWLDGLDESLVPTQLAQIAGDWLDPIWIAAQEDQGKIARAALDPRQLADFDPYSLGPTAGVWQLRIAGCKFYPGPDRALDLDHPGARWAIAAQLTHGRTWFPALVQRVLPELGAGVIGTLPESWLDRLQAWVGARPVLPSGSSAVGAVAANGWALVGTGSWGLASGLGHAELVAAGIDRALDGAGQVVLPEISAAELAAYGDRVRPGHYSGAI